MSQALRQRLYEQLDSIVLIDPHTHINALQPASNNLADILGYHYYTELVHSAGVPREQIEEAGLPGKEKVARLAAGIAPLENTIQYSWLIEMAQALLGFKDDRLTPGNWETMYNLAHERMNKPDWAQTVMKESKLEAVFLTNDFDDTLAGFDTQVFIPCLRTDELVFHLAKPTVPERLQRATGIAVKDAGTLRQAIGKLFDHFVSKGCRACAVSLPPDFAPRRIEPAAADRAVDAALQPTASISAAHQHDLSNFELRVLDARRVLRRVSTAFRSNDRRQPRGLHRRRLPRARPL
jgi:glucuronate isomerase